MGRNIPSVTYRIEAKARQWEKFARLLSAREREAFRELMAVVKNRRTAIGEADEADIGVAMLLAMVAYLKGEINNLNPNPQ